MYEAKFTKDLERGTLRVERHFDAIMEKVWKAHTESELLGEWWAPKPWKAVTVVMDFREGGRWFYYMLGPAGERHYCVQQYENIEAGKSFAGVDFFSDEEGNQKKDMPVSHWKTELFPDDAGTKLVSTITYQSGSDLEKILSMGMEAGYALGLNQLETLLQ